MCFFSTTSEEHLKLTGHREIYGEGWDNAFWDCAECGAWGYTYPPDHYTEEGEYIGGESE